MAAIEYRVIEETRFCEAAGYYSTYGINAVIPEPNGVCSVSAVFDLSLDRANVESLVILCNKLSLSVEHLRDIVYDGIE